MMHGLRFPKQILIFTLIWLFPASFLIGQQRSKTEIAFSKCWQYSIGSSGGRALTSDGSHVFVGSDGAKIEALSIEGKRLWSAEFGGDISSNLLAMEIGLFLTTSSISTDSGKAADSFVRGVSKDTGITKWTFKLPFAERYYLGARNSDLIIVSSSGVIHSLDAKSGNLRWSREIAASFSARPAFVSDKAFITTTDNQIFVLSIDTGEIKSMLRSDFAGMAVGGKANGDVAVGDKRGSVSMFLDRSDKPYWKFKSGGTISSVTTTGDNFLIASNDNFIYLLAGRNGSLIWKRRFSGRITNIGVVFERFAMVSSFEEHSFVLVEVNSGKVAGQIAFADDEIPIQDPVTSDGMIYLITNTSAYAVSIDSCGTK